MNEFFKYPLGHIVIKNLNIFIRIHDINHVYS